MLRPSADAHRGRLIASTAATLIALACGFNYAYSAWAPQFAEKLKLSSTQSNLIGLSGNLGMTSVSFFVGMAIDRYGPRPAILVGAALIFSGCLPVYLAWQAGHAPVGALCLFWYLAGVGSDMPVSAVMKISAINWPRYRGTATAFPNAAFGLSAFFFTSIASIFFPGDTGAFLKMLVLGTPCTLAVGFFFARIYPASDDQSYEALPLDDGEQDESAPVLSPLRAQEDPESSSTAKEVEVSEGPDVRGLALVRLPEFWKLAFIYAVLLAVGMMTINNIGNNVNALWNVKVKAQDKEAIIRAQQLHVSVLSMGSCSGRLLSGVGADLLVTRLGANRLWCITISCIIFILAQLGAIIIIDPHKLLFVSASSGLAYGCLLGAFPSIIADNFGINGFSQNCGILGIGPLLSVYLFNVFYGMTFDRHSVIEADGTHVCNSGVRCYQEAYYLTLAACVVSLGVTLRAIQLGRPRDDKEDGFVN